MKLLILLFVSIAWWIAAKMPMEVAQNSTTEHLGLIAPEKKVLKPNTYMETKFIPTHRKMRHSKTNILR